MSQVTKSQHGIVTKVIEEGNSKSKLRNRFTIAWLNTLLSSTPIVIDDAGTTRRSPWSLSTSVSFFPLATWSLLVIWHSPSRIRLSAAKSTEQNGTRLRRCVDAVLFGWLYYTHTRCFVLCWHASAVNSFYEMKKNSNTRLDNSSRGKTWKVSNVTLRNEYLVRVF